MNTATVSLTISLNRLMDLTTDCYRSAVGSPHHLFFDRAQAPLSTFLSSVRIINRRSHLNVPHSVAAFELLNMKRRPLGELCVNFHFNETHELYTDRPFTLFRWITHKFKE